MTENKRELNFYLAKKLSIFIVIRDLTVAIKNKKNLALQATKIVFKFRLT